MLPKISSAVADVKTWQLIHTRADTKVWRGFGPTPDYVLLGDFICVDTSNLPTPPADKIKNLKTVHISCLKRGTYTNSRLVEEMPAMSVWEISDSEGGVSSGFWRAALGGGMPNPTAYVLNPKYITQEN